MPTTLVVDDRVPDDAPDPGLRADPAEAHLVDAHPRPDRQRRAAEASSRTTRRSSGTGPYVAVEWEPGEFIRFARNPNYWGQQGAADEVDHPALRERRHDGPGPADRRDRLRPRRQCRPVRRPRRASRDILTVEGFANGYTYLSFNTEGNAEGYGGSTVGPVGPDVPRRARLRHRRGRPRRARPRRARRRRAPRIVPPYHASWHVDPTTPRTFDIEEAKRRSTPPATQLDGDGKRLDKEGKPINLRLTWPDSEAENGDDRPVHQDWFGQLGIGVDAAVTEEGSSSRMLTGPSGDRPAGHCDFYIWGWVGDPDPTSLLVVLHDRTDRRRRATASTRTPRTTSCSTDQRAERDPEAERAWISSTEMQQLFYDEAPYHVLYYDTELHAYRTDKFGGWMNQPPENGTPLFGYGPFGYTS